MNARKKDEKQSDYSKLCDYILGPPKPSPLKTCSLCNKKAEERFFHSIRLCLECWQKRVEEKED